MPITTLAPELLHQCLGHLGHKDLARASLVCREWLGPCRDHYWCVRARVNLADSCAELLAPVVGEGSMVPRKISGICIDESGDFEYREGEDTATWQNNLTKIMGHFSTISEFTVGCLDLTQSPPERRSQILRPGQVGKVLIVQWLKVDHAEEATSFILNQPNINFLGIGRIVLAKNGEDQQETGGNVGESKDEKEKTETEKKDKRDSEAMTPALPSPEPIIRLDKLRHLVLFSDSGGLAWSHVVPSLAKAELKELKTLVTDCHDRDAFVKLISAAAPALRSIAILFNGPGVDIDVSEAQSLKNLSISLARYPSKENVLADTVATVSSAPPSLEHLFLNIGPETIREENELDSAPSQWAALDAALARLPRLQCITIIVVFDSCISMFVSMTRAAGGVAEKWKNEALDYVKTKLPMSNAKGILEVKHVEEAWTSGAFAGYQLPE